MPPFLISEVGPENPATILFIVPLMTAICGLLTYGAGCFGVQTLVSACPFSVFGGFIAGTGAQLLEFGLGMMLPKFTGFLENSSELFASTDAIIHWLPGTAIAAAIFVAQRYPYFANSHTLLPGTLVVVAAVFFMGMGIYGVDVADAREVTIQYNLAGQQHPCLLFDLPTPCFGPCWHPGWVYFRVTNKRSFTVRAAHELHANLDDAGLVSRVFLIFILLLTLESHELIETRYFQGVN
jgi:MFS superfamily sulfate permease-like transporter